MQTIENVNIAGCKSVPTPAEIHEKFPLPESAENTVVESRRAIGAILDGTDPRLFAVVGPCSIHDSGAALEYASRLKALADDVQETLVVVMRVYFEKPRTTVGWKGFINDPDMDDSFQVGKGLMRARELLIKIVGSGLPAGTEALDPISPQYTADLISWYAIGARTTESQTHRELASGLSAPVGFKNSTDGSVAVAINAVTSASQPHHFLGITPAGQIAVFETRGNRHGHLILRGGPERPNYDSVSVLLTERQLDAAKVAKNIVIDCSHGNSSKDHRVQPLVLEDVVNQIRSGNRSIVGFMLESHLSEGRQNIPKDRSQLAYGVSVTDACIDWATTEAVLRKSHAALLPLLPERRRS